MNALVEATLSDSGPAAAILAAWESRKIVLVTCEAIVLEYQNVLSRQHIRRRYPHVSSETTPQYVDAIRRFGHFVTPRSIPPIVSGDSDDDVILACALEGSADYVVTRDRHLLRLTEYSGVPILPPHAFLPVLRRWAELL